MEAAGPGSGMPDPSGRDSFMDEVSWTNTLNSIEALEALDNEELWYEERSLDTQALPVQTREAVVASGYVIDIDDLLQQSNDLDDHSSTRTLTKEEGELSENMIMVSASIKLPFSADLAFDVFSDAPRQPFFSYWLHSVSYIDECDFSKMQYSECGFPMRPTRWLVKWGKLRYGWDAMLNRVERPNIIEWESTSGLKNIGMIEFSETMVNDGSAGAGGYTGVLTDVTISFKFMAPRFVARVLGKSNGISAFVEQQILMPMLVKFRDVVMEKDLGMDVGAIQRTLSTLEEEV